MRKFISLLFAIGLVITACQEAPSVVEPMNDNNSSGLNKSWIQLPPKDASPTSIETMYATKAEIFMDKGGYLALSSAYTKVRVSTKASVEFKAYLEIPPYAFHDEKSKVFYMMVDDVTCSATFYPTPFTWDKPLKLTLVYAGLDLSNFDADNVEFAYLAANGKIEVAKYEKITVDKNNGVLQVQNAYIPHFSRFGFVN